MRTNGNPTVCQDSAKRITIAIAIQQCNDQMTAVSRTVTNPQDFHNVHNRLKSTQYIPDAVATYCNCNNNDLCFSLGYWCVDVVLTFWHPYRDPRQYSNLRLLTYLITVYFKMLVIYKNIIIRYFNFYCKRNGIPLSAYIIVPSKCSLLAWRWPFTVETCFHNVIWVYI